MYYKYVLYICIAVIFSTCFVCFGQIDHLKAFHRQLSVSKVDSCAHEQKLDDDEFLEVCRISYMLITHLKC